MRLFYVRNEVANPRLREAVDIALRSVAGAVARPLRGERVVGVRDRALPFGDGWHSDRRSINFSPDDLKERCGASMEHLVALVTEALRDWCKRFPAANPTSFRKKRPRNDLQGPEGKISRG